MNSTDRNSKCCSKMSLLLLAYFCLAAPSACRLGQIRLLSVFVMFVSVMCIIFSFSISHRKDLDNCSSCRIQFVLLNLISSFLFSWWNSAFLKNSQRFSQTMDRSTYVSLVDFFEPILFYTLSTCSYISTYDEHYLITNNCR